MSAPTALRPPRGLDSPRLRPGYDATAPIRHVDWLLLACSVAIAVIGLAMVYSTTRGRIPGDPTYFVQRQGMFFVIGLVVLVVVALIIVK